MNREVLEKTFGKIVEEKVNKHTGFTTITFESGIYAMMDGENCLAVFSNRESAQRLLTIPF